jgi:hypothetical protein|eukprot:m.218550 g.218550  ORF g.218550 m.218550 type:complete len:275 (+) comp25711_c2_seq1:318-1142(+)
MNAVYSWPFDLAQAGGNSVNVLDIHGNPHVEESDPGIFPSYLLDYGRPAGPAAFLAAINRYVVHGVADGVFLDNFDQIPMACHPKGSDNCTALRNQWASKYNRPSRVTPEQVVAYTAGMNTSLTAAATAIRTVGGAFADFTAGDKPNANGATMAVMKSSGVDPIQLAELVNTTFTNGYSWLLLLPHAFSSPASHTAPTSQCSEFEVAAMLLALREGVFIACNGWSDDFGRPLGRPLGPATTKDGVMQRRFAGGAVAEWVVNTTNATVTWPATSK